MIKVFCILILFTMTFYGYRVMKKTGDIFNPILTFILPIAIGFIFFEVFFADETNDRTVAIYALGILSFFLGYLLHRFLSRYPYEYSNIEVVRGVEMSTLTVQLLKLITVIAIVLNIFYIVRIAFSGPYGSNVLRNIRYMTGYVVSKDPITEYSMAIAKTYFIIVLYQYYVEDKKYLKRWLILTTMASIVGILTTVARTQILTLVISWLYISSLKRRTTETEGNRLVLAEKIHERFRIVITVSALFFIFYYLALKTVKLGSASFSEENFFINKYMGRALFVFDRYFYDSAGQGKGFYSLGWITRILTSFHLIKSPNIIERIQALYTRGAVASFMRAPYVDFGVFGVSLVMFFHGMISGFVYKRALRKVSYWSIFYTSYIYSNVLAFFDYQYMMTSQLYLFLILVLCGWKFRKKISL